MKKSKYSKSKSTLGHTPIGSFRFTLSNFQVDFIEVYYCLAKQTPLSECKVLIVMTGMNRNAEGYRNFWIDHAERHNLIVLVPCFPSISFPGGRSYILGNMYDEMGNINNKRLWLFSIIPLLFEWVKKELDLPQKEYYLFGHSAGAQFVHRFLFFNPNNKVVQAIAANAGWYTLLDQRQAFPYGLYNSPFQKKDLASIFQQSLIIALGTADTDKQSPNLRHTHQADRQGLNRYQRGKYFFEKAKKISQRKKLQFNWQMIEIEGVGHSPSKMIHAMASILFKKK